jgi:ABC-type nitrate/sulfonate/bicarbonate transport system substrate-binding protein
MRLNIPDSRKKIYLESSRHSVAGELYTALAKFGIDPDDVDIENPLENVQLANLNESQETQAAYLGILSLCDTYVLLSQKMENL